MLEEIAQQIPHGPVDGVRDELELFLHRHFPTVSPEVTELQGTYWVRMNCASPAEFYDTCMRVMRYLSYKTGFTCYEYCKTPVHLFRFLTRNESCTLAFRCSIEMTS